LPRQIDGEFAAAADSAVDIDAAAQVGHDAVHQRQPEPGAMPAALVVKNGSKMRSSTCGAMPVPVSRTASLT
jgi:hypothetical protein